MATAQVEYVGFTTTVKTREYRLRVRAGAGTGEFHDFIVTIPCEAFLAHRVRYQDAPEICFLKLQRALVASADGMPAAQLAVSDAELEEYRAAHTPKPAQRRPRAPIAPIAPPEVSSGAAIERGAPAPRPPGPDGTSDAVYIAP